MSQTPETNQGAEERSARTRPAPMHPFQTPTDIKNAMHLGNAASTPVTATMTPPTPFSESPRDNLCDEGYLGQHDTYQVKRLFREKPHQQDDLHLIDSCRVSPPTSRRSRRHSFPVRRYSKSSRSRSMKPHESFDFSITPSTSSYTDAIDDSAPSRFSSTLLKRVRSLSFGDQKIRLSHQKSLILTLGVVLLISMGIIFRSDCTMNDELLQQHERTIRRHQRHHNGPMSAGLRGDLVKMGGGRTFAERSRFRPPQLE